jgi:hypothetical protein
LAGVRPTLLTYFLNIVCGNHHRGSYFSRVAERKVDNPNIYIFLYISQTTISLYTEAKKEGTVKVMPGRQAYVSLKIKEKVQKE